MRTTTFAALAAVGLITLGSAAQAQVTPVKIGYVNSEALMAAAPGRAVAEAAPGSEVSLRVLRNRRPVDIVVKLARRPDDGVGG